MFRSIKIENFRGFKHFELQQLGRINLLVGLNNSGKTFILEFDFGQIKNTHLFIRSE
jgi:AAA15 family ATPase/GTPase